MSVPRQHHDAISRGGPFSGWEGCRMGSPPRGRLTLPRFVDIEATNRDLTLHFGWSARRPGGICTSVRRAKGRNLKQRGGQVRSGGRATRELGEVHDRIAKAMAGAFVLGLLVAQLGLASTARADSSSVDSYIELSATKPASGCTIEAHSRSAVVGILWRASRSSSVCTLAPT